MKIIEIYQYYFRKYDLHKYLGEKNLHLGCGNKYIQGFINVDFYNIKCADQIVDLNEKLPYQNNSFDLVYSDNVFEHIKNLLLLIQESHRLLKNENGTLVIKVPYFKSKHAFVDPTHINFFTIQSMDYYVNNTFFYNEYRFFDECFSSLEIFLDPDKKGFIKRIIEFIAIKRPNYFENSILSNIYVFHNIVYVLKK